MENEHPPHADKLHDSVLSHVVAVPPPNLVPPVEQAHAPQVPSATPRSNYHIPDDFAVPNGQKSKYQNNAAAIRLLKELEQGGVLASAEQQHILARYVGWGGIPQAFDAGSEGWKREYAELNELLAPKEYSQARRSTLNAFYTSPTVIKAMYQTLLRFGFDGGSILEPAMGVGNFLGLLPPELADCKLYGVELDEISGRIAQHLYPQANIFVQGFEETQLFDSAFDVVIGNVPFGGYKLSDKRYDRYNFLIHDFFFAKSLDKVRPGGVISFVTSKGTMDKQNESVRRYIAERAELIGAVRLPNTAFKQNANTEVTTDILFLQRRETLMTGDYPSWVELGKTPDGVPVNRYYEEHPDMLLGVMSYDDTMYGNETDTTMRPFDDGDLQTRLTNALATLRCTMTRATVTQATAVSAPPDVKNYTYTMQDGAVFYRYDSELVRKTLPKATEGRIRGMVSIKQYALAVIQAQEQNCSDVHLVTLQHSLNESYDRFTKAFGALNATANKRAFADDVNQPLLLALEKQARDNTYEKAEIFYKRTIKPNLIPSSAESAEDALMLSINYRNGVDIGYMQSLYPHTPQKIVEELGSLVYLNPVKDRADDVTAGWETAEEYLSGNVRAKLTAASSYAQNDARFGRNVQALKLVQPTPLTANEIDVRMGVNWIPNSDYNAFLYALLKTPLYLQGINEN
ncbi:MAG: N-6 DNA methylase, partial [Acetanaerobacterium sp.]